MRWPFKRYDYLYLFVICFNFYANALTWPLCKTCGGFIPLFGTAALITFSIEIICLAFLRAPDLPTLARKWLTRFFFFILPPFCIYLSIQGAIWQIILMIEIPDCPVISIYSNLIWLWIFGLFFSGTFFAYIGYFKLRLWWRTRQFRRRRELFAQLAANGEHDRLDELLLEAEDVNNRVGLLPSDLEKLEIKDYQSSLSTLISRNESEMCPICCEDFKAGDKMAVLPRCKHTYHPGCVNEWLLKTPLCPLCRGNVRSGLLRDQRAPGDVENPLGS